MELELLPNELLLDLFNYFDGTDLLRVFYGLNSRFNQLLYQQFLFYRFSFYSISKIDFDIVCQQHLPCIANQVFALELSDQSTTPKQINLFLSYIPSFKQFTRLRSLTIYSLKSYETLLKLLDDCQQLVNLTRLCLYFCCMQDSSANSQLIIDKIWNLPKLTDCYINTRIGEDEQFYVPTIISTSLERISISHSGFQWNKMYQLIQCTPRLKYLLTSIKSLPNYNNTQNTFLTMTRCHLNLKDIPDVTSAGLFFQSMPNLRHLNIRTRFGLIMNGYEWEHIIRNYLPKLKIFNLEMQKYFGSHANIQQNVDELYDSFHTPFWINERKWFIWCLVAHNTIYIYTRSNASKYYNYILPNSCRSTCPDDHPSDFYNHVTTIYDVTVFDKTITPTSDIRLPNIDCLGIKLPINDQFWSSVPSLKRLKTLSISFYADIYQSQLETLFDRISCLNSLRISQIASLPLQMSLFTYTHFSVSQLDLDSYKHRFDVDQCHILACSHLGRQCEVLSIQVTNRQSIITLVRNMINLRSLKVKCADDPYKKESGLMKDYDELVEWLKERLSLSYVIVRDTDDNNNVLIWI